MRTILLLFSIWLGSSAFAANWPQFRGPNATGLDTSAPAPTERDVDSNKNILWKTPIPGLSHASPIIWGNRVYVITAVRPGAKPDLKVGLYGDIASADDQTEHEWRLLALDRASGKIVFDEPAHKAIPRVKRHTKATHANSTPATDGKRIAAIFGSEGLFCFSADTGKPVWTKDLGPMDSGFFQVPTAQWGFASSPIIYDNRVIVQCDVQTNSFLASFNISDGKEIWRTPRNDVPTWSTPTVVNLRIGGPQILVNGWHHTGGYDFANGKEIWRLDGGGDIPTPTPILGDGLAYFTSAHGRFRPMMAIRLDAKDNITPETFGETNAAIAWIHPRKGNYMQTPILVGDYLYGCNDGGEVTCFDAKTGAIQFGERLSAGREGFTASPVSDGKHLYFAREDGNVFVLPATNKFSVISTNNLGEIAMATPALASGTLYYRTRDHLIAIGKK